MKTFRNPSKFLISLLILITLESCKTYATLNSPTEKLPMQLKAGDMVNITLVNGAQTGIIKVQTVRSDSLLLGASTHYVKYSEIKKIKKAQFDIVATLMVGASAAAIVWVIAQNPSDFLKP
jgi:hypothetical protein